MFNCLLKSSNSLCRLIAEEIFLKTDIKVSVLEVFAVIWVIIIYEIKNTMTIKEELASITESLDTLKFVQFISRNIQNISMMSDIEMPDTTFFDEVLKGFTPIYKAKAVGEEYNIMVALSRLCGIEELSEVNITPKYIWASDKQVYGYRVNTNKLEAKGNKMERTDELISMERYDSDGVKHTRSRYGAVTKAEIKRLYDYACGCHEIQKLLSTNDYINISIDSEEMTFNIKRIKTLAAFILCIPQNNIWMVSNCRGMNNTVFKGIDRITGCMCQSYQETMESNFETFSLNVTYK